MSSDQGIESKQPNTPEAGSTSPDALVATCMKLVEEALLLPEGDQQREKTLLALMDEIDAARAKGILESSTIGQGSDRVIILRKPTTVELTEPAHLAVKAREKEGLRFGTMITFQDVYLAINRQRITGLAVTNGQTVQIVPTAEMFSDEGSAYFQKPEEFEAMYGNWLKGVEEIVANHSVAKHQRIQQLMGLTDYQPRPDTSKYPQVDMVSSGSQYDQDSKKWVDSDEIRPDGVWAGFVKKNEGDVIKPGLRSPAIGQPWFDTDTRYAAFVIQEPGIVEGVVRANITQLKPTGNPSPQAA